MLNINSPSFQVITSLPDPLSLFFRPGRADHTTLDQAMSENRTFAGGIFDPCHVTFQEEVLSHMTERGLRAVLDPLMLELSTPLGLTPPRKKLVWADAAPHQQEHFNGRKVDRTARLIAEFVIEHHFDSVLAPTHYLAKGANDPWFLIDRRLTYQLRRELDSAGGMRYRFIIRWLFPHQCSLIRFKGGPSKRPLHRRRSRESGCEFIPSAQIMVGPVYKITLSHVAIFIRSESR